MCRGVLGDDTSIKYYSSSNFKQSYHWWIRFMPHLKPEPLCWNTLEYCSSPIWFPPIAWCWVMWRKTVLRVNVRLRGMDLDVSSRGTLQTFTNQRKLQDSEIHALAAFHWEHGMDYNSRKELLWAGDAHASEMNCDPYSVSSLQVLEATSSHICWITA